MTPEKLKEKIVEDLAGFPQKIGLAAYAIDQIIKGLVELKKLGIEYELTAVPVLKAKTDAEIAAAKAAAEKLFPSKPTGAVES